MAWLISWAKNLFSSSSGPEERWHETEGLQRRLGPGGPVGQLEGQSRGQ
jgi:hypothetical protein